MKYFSYMYTIYLFLDNISLKILHAMHKCHQTKQYALHIKK